MQAGTGLELVLNAAEGALQIVVTEDEKLLCVQEWHKADRATEILAPALAEICSTLGIAPTAFRRIACVRGPGSFTGIRLVLTTAAALRRVGQARLAGLDYMQALATSAVLQHNLFYGTPVWVLTHARRNLVHCQPFMSYGPLIPGRITMRYQPLTSIPVSPEPNDPIPVPDPRPRPHPLPDPPPDDEPIKLSHRRRRSERIRACPLCAC